jgi:hypothetical protein
VFLKLWPKDHCWSGAVSEEKIANIIFDTKRMKNTPTHVCDKLPLLADLRQKVGELVLPITSSPLIIKLTCGYCNFNHRYNVSPIQLHALLGVGNFTKVVRVCADRL